MKKAIQLISNLPEYDIVMTAFGLLSGLTLLIIYLA